MKHELAVELSKKIMELVDNPPLYEEDVYLQIRIMSKKSEEEVVATLAKMVHDWEIEVMEDTSLYTLGLRRAIDVIQGTLPL